MADDLRALTQRFPRQGRIEAIWLRPARGQPACAVHSVEAQPGRGLAGDRSAERKPAGPGGGKRQVTLIQAEHLPLIGGWNGVAALNAGALRRNLVVSGINLLSLRSPLADQPVRVRIGADVLIEVTGPCDPCSKMEQLLGPGGYNTMRGHGGVTARVLEGGVIVVGDELRVTGMVDINRSDQA